jgi:hypothetical protein
MTHFFLHARKNGMKCRLSAKPASMQTFKVTQDGDYEFTTTARNGQKVGEATPPPGNGWKLDSTTRASRRKVKWPILEQIRLYEARASCRKYPK